MITLTIDDCIKLHKKGVETVVNDGKVQSFINARNEIIDANMFFYYFVASER